MSESIVYNATNESQTVRLQGAFFTFKPKQMKLMSADKADFIASQRKEYGLVVLPEAFLDSEYKDTPEGQALLAEATKQGIDNLISFHRDIIRNNQVSLRRDLAQADEKIDPAILMSKGELNSLELVAKYQVTGDDSEQKKLDHVKELMKTIGPVLK